ncbi:response regulator receiver modulated GAF sensor protein [Rhodopirellula maiorica SM1]|uniref:Response regulator receiver modulated GAF sensor protein n=1 Tax=Rhodopirellula maiorica SM1 TaxID=1265738 RepID=M5S9Q9_9BACT|nr:response regulator [Rhodopirellula maiorica]EMI22914.1 response regulator receiver modulated GAF sensor protein [Rhodopirellula maiorica SM1]
MTKSHSILIVDDEPDVLFSLTGLLRRDFTVHTATSGSEALQIMAEHPVHVIMTDQRMPSMTGSELMQKVRNEHPEAVRIIFTGYADTRAVVDAINQGELYRYITKPWDPDDLLEMLKEAAQRHDVIDAREELMQRLGSYLDDAESVTDAVDDSQLVHETLERFKSQTASLRQTLERARGDDE